MTQNEELIIKNIKGIIEERIALRKGSFMLKLFSKK